MASVPAPPECGIRCRSARDAEKCAECVRRAQNQAEALFALIRADVCGNPAWVTDALGRTLLHICATWGKQRLVEFLLKHRGAAINARDVESGYTALHRAIFQGELGVVNYLLQQGANASLCDYDSLTPIEHAHVDALKIAGPLLEGLDHSSPADVYCWGSNINYNLGIGHQKERLLPEANEYFRRQGIHISKLSMGKFHTGFIATNGNVYTCGHGRGGRLGYGCEDSQLTPRQVKGLSCNSICLGADHTIFLTTKGAIYTCGMNTYFQLGILPAPEMTHTPKKVKSSKKASEVLGIAAGRFHSLFYTNNELYTWGLNAGQLGHREGPMIICLPKVVPCLKFYNFRISCVGSSDAAIVVCNEVGEVFALHQYKTRMITPKVITGVVKVEVIGGHLNPKVMPSAGNEDSAQNSFKLIEKGGDDLKVFLMTKFGQLSVWEENRSGGPFNCIYNVCRDYIVQDFVASRTSMLLVMRNGLCYEGMHHRSKPDTNPSSPTTKKKSKNKLSKTQPDMIKLRRLPGVFRATQAAIDPKGRNFAVVQAHANIGLVDVPEVSGSECGQDMRRFLDEATDDPHDPLVDVTFVVGAWKRRFPAHSFIVASASDLLARKLIAIEKSDDDPEVHLPDIDPEHFQTILQYIYTKTCDPLSLGHVMKPCQAAQVRSLSPEPPASSIGIAVVSSPKTVSAFEVHQKNKKTKKKAALAGSAPQTAANQAHNGLTALQEAAQELQIYGLVRALDNVKLNADGVVCAKKPGWKHKPHLALSRKSFPELTDVSIICSSDGLSEEDPIRAHRCVLAARLEYFRSMFQWGWRESQREETLNLPVPSKFLSVVLDFLYRDECPAALSTDDIELVSNVLVLADQLLVPRLLEMCERQLSQMLTLRNAGELLQFSLTYHADQLKRATMQFMTHNLAAILEGKILNQVDDECLEHFTAYYKSQPTLKQRELSPPTSEPPQFWTEIKAAYDANPMSVAELFAEEEAQLAQQALRNSAKKQTPRSRRNSSGERHRRSRRSSASSTTPSDSGSDSAGSFGGIDDDDDVNVNELDNLSIQSLDDLHFEEKQPEAPAAAAATVGQQKEVASEDFLESFFINGGKMASYSNGQQSAGNGMNRRFQKKSQKERKKALEAQQQQQQSLLRQQQQQQQQAQDIKCPKWSGWGTSNGSPEAVTSFSEIMKGQKKDQGYIISTDATPTPPASSSAAPSGSAGTKRAKKSSWRQLSFTDDDYPTTSVVTSPPVKNPWKTAPVVQGKDLHKNGADYDGDHFRHIQSAEAENSANLSKAASKSLESTQLEEKAIGQLLKFYNASSVVDEKITVMRVDKGGLATPIWKRHNKK